MSKTPIIIDLGSYEIKAGFHTSNQYPSIKFLSYIGEPKFNKIIRQINIHNTEKRDQYVGDDCTPYLGILKLHYPIKHGAFTNEDDIPLVFNHIFNKLGLEGNGVDHPLLIAEALLNPKDNREKISEILFEKYNIPGLVFGYQPSLSLFSLSSTIGVVLESGDGVSQICSIIDGYSIPCSFIRYNFGGNDVNEYLRQALKKKGIELISDTEKLLLHEIKIKHVLCQIAETKSEEERSSTYRLPDSRVIEIDNNEYSASNVMFNPSLVGKNYLGLHQMVATCIEKVNLEYREKLCNNIKLTGGNSSMKNFNQVMHTQLQDILPKNKGISIKVNTINCTISSWNGGNIITELGIFKDLLVTKKEWDEQGKDIVHKKSF